MCGPTANEKALEASSQNFSSILQQNYNAMFSKQQGVLDAVNRSLNPTLAAGPSQRGFSPNERAAYDTQAINAAGAANRNAQQAARTYGAGQGGGGTSGVTSGITKQIESAIGSQSAEALGARQGQIEQADWATGRDNYWRAEGGMQTLAGGYGAGESNATEGSISANKQAFEQENVIRQQNMEKSQMIAGGITSLAGMATGGIAGMAASPAGASQPLAFLSGMFGKG